MPAEAEDLIGKLREIEEQASFAMQEIPRGLTHGRVHHILILARFIRLKLQANPQRRLKRCRKSCGKPASCRLLDSRPEVVELL
jgi:hypothetical protein